MERNSVSVSTEGDKFVVTVTENGNVSHKSFDAEEYARSWADGQRFRVCPNGSAPAVAASD